MKVEYPFATFELYKATTQTINDVRLSIVLSASTKLWLYKIVYHGYARELFLESRSVVAFPDNRVTRILQELDSIYSPNFQTRILLGEEDIDRHLYHIDLNFGFYLKLATSKFG